MKKNIVLLLFVLVTALITGSRNLFAQRTAEQDSLALVALYNSTNGNNWTDTTNWLTGEVSTWFGITVIDGRVLAINLEGNNLTGELPVELGDLTGVAQIELGQNQLSGVIPNEIGSLANLETLILESNRLSATIPEVLGNLTKLEFLSLSNNLFTGAVPASIANLTELIGLELSNNQLVDLPDLSAMPSLRFLVVSDNRLTFEDIEPNLSIGSFDYAPQDSVGSGQQISVRLNSRLEVSVTVGGENNEYQWFKDNQLITGATDSLFAIPKATFSDTGNYYCTVTNTEATDLTLRSRAIHASIEIRVAASDSLALVALYDSTGGGNWLHQENWLQGPVSTWRGVTVADGRINGLTLNANNLAGELPPDIAILTNLESLVLQSNQLSGEIPAEIGALTNLTFLDLGKNEFTGEIPSTIENLVDIEDLLLGDNQLSGDVPQGITNLSNLSSIDLSNNQLTGLPNLSPLSSLGILLVQNNKYTFEDIEPNVGVPSFTFTYSPQQNIGARRDTSIFLNSPFTAAVSVGGSNNNYQWFKDGAVISDSTESIFSISMVARSDSGSYYCHITNTIATDLTLISEPVLITVDTRIAMQDSLALVALYNSTNGRNWTGNKDWLLEPLSTPWFGVSVAGGRVTQIDLPDNNLVGTIPSAINSLTGLEFLELRHNTLTGQIPVEIGGLSSLKALGLAENQLSGAIPASIGNLTNLTALTLADNNLTGELPEEIGNLAYLSGLELTGNQLFGQLPVSVANLTNLTGLLLSDNQFSGIIPRQITNLTNLFQLDLRNNQFSDLPDLSSVTALSSLLIQNNRFSFEDIEPNLGIDVFEYVPQDSTGENREAYVTVDMPLTISINVGGANNRYQWSKDGELIEAATDSSLTIATAVLADSGNYTCEITNTVVTDLTLHSRPIKVTVDSRPDVFSEAASGITDNSAVLNGRVNPNGLTTTVLFEYMLAEDTMQVVATQSPIIGDDTVSVNAIIANLAPNATYRYRTIAINRADTIQGAVREFKTLLPPYPAQFNVHSTTNYPELLKAEDYQATDYRLIGLPGNSERPIKSFIEGEQDKDWQIYWDNGEQSNFQVVNDGSNTFLASTGKAFWVVHKGPLEINTTLPSTQLSGFGSNREILIPLHEGWNLITNPFTISIPWSSVQAVNGPTPILDPIWAFNGSFAQSELFEPNVGYYFFNTIKLTTLRVPYELYYPDPGDPVSTAIPAATWRVNISLTSGKFNETGTTFGISEIAEAGLDEMDVRKPRALGSLPGITFSRPEWDAGFSRFASDFRPDSKEPEVWPFEVEASTAVTSMIFSGISSLSAQQAIYLIEDASGEYFDLKADSIHSFTPRRDITNFRVVAGEADAVNQYLTTVMPREFSLGQNYPNPFNPTTSIPVSIPVESDITIKIYNITGQEVATVFKGIIQPGRHVFNWDGRNPTGNRPASGVYFYRLDTGKKAAMVGKMILLK